MVGKKLAGVTNQTYELFHFSTSALSGGRLYICSEDIGSTLEKLEY